MFAFNSGYGYDALEYLVIGRSLVDGYHLYDFIPSKSFGLYGLVAGLLKTGLPLGHFSLSVVVAGLFCANVVPPEWWRARFSDGGQRGSAVG